MSRQRECQYCTSKNPPGSKFCNNCGHALPPTTSLICPNCATSNSRDRLYCDNCGTRLLVTTTLIPPPSPPESPSKPQITPHQRFSLPAKPVGQTGELDPRLVPEWLHPSTKKKPPTIPPDPQEQQAQNKETLSDWLQEMENDDNLEKPNQDDSPSSGKLPDWLQKPQEPTPPPDALPEDWLSELTTQADDNDDDDSLPLPNDWLSDLTTSPAPSESNPTNDNTDSDMPEDWLSDLTTSPSSTDNPPPTESDLPNWLELSASNVEKSDTNDDEATPDWLQPGSAAPSPPNQPASPSAPPEPDDDIPDWLQ
ncbi:MAG TPA: zinc ribbon domain-containing protein, partial [Anaerolineae bacterium]|nr:zinc ribbon domain-containing protein [Anaerolineae bacterium]